VGQVAGQVGECPDQGRQVLAGLDRAQPEHIRAVQPEAAAEVGDPLGEAGRRSVPSGVTSTRLAGTSRRSAGSAAVVADTHSTRVAAATARRMAQP
jgi:hypothetical protein